MNFLGRNGLVDVGLDVEYAPVVETTNTIVNQKNMIKTTSNLRDKSSLARPQLRALASAVCQGHL